MEGSSGVTGRVGGGVSPNTELVGAEVRQDGSNSRYEDSTSKKEGKEAMKTDVTSTNLGR